MSRLLPGLAQEGQLGAVAGGSPPSSERPRQSTVRGRRSPVTRGAAAAPDWRRARKRGRNSRPSCDSPPRSPRWPNVEQGNEVNRVTRLAVPGDSYQSPFLPEGEERFVLQRW
jgi:hypothetical protein